MAIRDIKKYQKLSSNLIFSKSSFEKIVRNIFPEDTKISKNVFIIFQYFIEQYITKLLYNANFLAIHSNRVKVLSIDIALVSYLNGDTKNPYNSLSIESDILETHSNPENQFEINNNLE